MTVSGRSDNSIKKRDTITHRAVDCRVKSEGDKCPSRINLGSTSLLRRAYPNPKSICWRNALLSVLYPSDYVPE